MKKLLLIISTLIGFIANYASAANIAIYQAISQEQAYEYIVLDYSKQFPDMDVYSMKEDNDSHWKFFVDLYPLAGWEHDCYIVKIPKAVVKGGSIELKKELRQLPPNEEYTSYRVHNFYGDNATSKPLVKRAEQPNYPSEAAQRTYAIILSGGVRCDMNYERYWNDCSFIYQTLVNKYGVPKDHIYPIMSDGNNPAKDMKTTVGEKISQPLDLDFDGINEIEMSASLQNVQNTLNILSGQLNKDDHLFFYVIDHGSFDKNTNQSYICLWNEEKLYDDQLATMLEEFCDHFVNVNVVLGQCFSGGFIDDLTKVGCVVATASAENEYSWACSDIPYDDFVYHWTCAVAGANHKQTVLETDADTDNNGNVTMLEAFEYACKNDGHGYKDGKPGLEHPQYISTPISVGEDLSFNHLAPAVDLYIPDNYEDTGKEPNLTTDILWDSPSVWTRNTNDTIERHENPIYSPTQAACYIYVKIYNRGKEEYNTKNMWLHTYWAAASTVIGDQTWFGAEMSPDSLYATGGPVSSVCIQETIKPGEYIIMPITWQYPNIMLDTAINDRHHFCIRAKILPTHYTPLPPPGNSYFDLRGSNDVAQKNVTIVPKINPLSHYSLYLRNPLPDAPTDAIVEIRPRTENDKNFFNYANVEMTLSNTIDNAWTKGGSLCSNVDVNNSNTIGNRKVVFKSADSQIRSIKLNGGEFGKVSLNFNFHTSTLFSKTYTLDLVQKDNEGNIIGGETYIVESPGASPYPITIDPVFGDSITLHTNANSFSAVEWRDANDNIIGNSETITVRPTMDNHDYFVKGISHEGDMAVTSISLESKFGIESLSYTSASNDFLKVVLAQPCTENGHLLITSFTDGSTPIISNLLSGEKEIILDVKNLKSGLYVITYKEGDETICSQKFTK